MRIHPILLIFCALLLAVSPAAAQPALAQQQPGAGELLDQNEQRPFDRLMQVRDELQLSDGQVGRLQQIALRLEATNRPLREELVRRWQAYREQRRAELLRMTPEQRQAELARVRAQGAPPVPDDMRALMQRIRGNIQAAKREAGTVLSPGQKARARQLLRERRAERMGGGMRGRGMGRGRARAGVP